MIPLSRPNATGRSMWSMGKSLLDRLFSTLTGIKTNILEQVFISYVFMDAPANGERHEKRTEIVARDVGSGLRRPKGAISAKCGRSSLSQARNPRGVGAFRGAFERDEQRRAGP